MKASLMWEIRGLFFAVLSAVSAATWVSWVFTIMTIFCVALCFYEGRQEYRLELLRRKFLLEQIAKMEGVVLPNDDALKNKEKPNESA